MSEPWPSWRYAWRMHRFRPRRQLINLSFVFVGWAAGLLPGVAAKVVFDHLAHTLRHSSLHWLLWPLALLGVRALAGVATWFTLQSTNGAFTFANTAMLQRNLLRRVLALPGGKALPASPGEAVSRFRDDTELVAWYPIMFNNVLGSMVTGAIAFVVMVRISPLITIAVFIPLLLVIGIVEAARTRIVLYREANRVRTSEVTGFIADVFEAVQSVQVAGAEDRVVERFRDLNAHRRRAAVRDRLLEELLEGAFWIVNLGTGALLLVAGRSLRSGSFTVGDLALFVYFLGVFQNFSSDIGQGLAGYRQLGVSFARMHTLLVDRPANELVADDDIYERGPLPPATAPLPDVDRLRELRVDGLTYNHAGDGSGISDISFRVPRGSFTVVTGRIGSGKTTLLQCLLGLVPAQGRVLWNGEEVADPPTFLIPPRTAYTPQVAQLFSETLFDNIALGVEGDIAEAVRLAVLEDDVAEMPDGLGTAIGSRGLRLSGGQIQRAAAARMFIRRPELLVCDDLSSALDVETEAQLWERVLGGGDRTVLAVSHRRAALQRADQVIVLRDGTVDDIGPLADLLGRCDEMRALWRLEDFVESA
ncbi:MAG: ATP-binding cassette, subfamily bacterial [Actinomycetota bacterium]